MHDPHIADGTLQHKLDAARKKWKAAHVSSYRYEIQVSCFCPPATKPNVFTVKKGAPAKYPSGYKSLATVPRLFKTIQGAIDDNVANLNVSYGKRGVPTSIYIDRAYNVADEEVGYTVKHFTRVKLAAGTAANGTSQQRLDGPARRGRRRHRRPTATRCAASALPAGQGRPRRRAQRQAQAASEGPGGGLHRPAPVQGHPAGDRRKVASSR